MFLHNGSKHFELVSEKSSKPEQMKRLQLLRTGILQVLRGKTILNQIKFSLCELLVNSFKSEKKEFQFFIYIYI